MMRSALHLFLTSALVAANGVAEAAVPPICPPGRFVVQGAPLLGFGTDGSDAVTVSRADPATATVSTATGCAPIVASKLKATKRGTKVQAQWLTGCGIWTRKIILKTLIDPATCGTMRGTFKFRDTNGRRIRRGFTAGRSAPGTCEDGGVDTFALIQSRIFYGRGCNVSSCHGPFAQADLDLSQEAAWLSLVNVPASNPTAQAAGKLRALPGDPAASFLSQKLHGTLAPGEGSQMPLIGPQLPAEELALIDAWIRGGAPATGRVPDAPCLLPNEYVPTPAPPVPAGGYQIVLDGPVLQPGQEQEGCVWIRLPNTTDFTVGKWEFALNPGTHHFAVFPYDAAGTPPSLNTWRAGDVGCISGANFGNALSGSPQAPYFTQVYPPGIARVLPGGSYIGLNAHYRNYWQAPIQIKVWTNLYPVQGTPQHLAQTIIDYQDMFSINVPVNTQKIQPGRWHNTSGQPYQVYSITGHMHQRGLRFTARKSDGTVIYENFDFAHPIFRQFVPPLVLNPGDWIDYECLHDNGVTRPVRRDSFGNPTTLVFGVTTEDEMCTLNGEFYTQ
jgi:hypothetical protein